MRISTLMFALALTGCASAPGPAPASTVVGGPPDVARGGQLYTDRCGACHSPDVAKRGPAHRGVFGRKAAAAPGYEYSAALGASGIVWDASTLDRWLTGPKAMVPGTKMGGHIDSAKDRTDLIAYLHSISADK